MAINENVLNWLASSDTGASSRSIVAWMERDKTVLAMNGNYLSHPWDPADLGRCIRLLDIEPSYRERIGEMAGASPVWARLVARWGDLERLYHEAEPSGQARECYDLMQELIRARDERQRSAARAASPEGADR